MSIRKNIFNNRIPSIPPGVGKMLVSDPMKTGSIFSHSVILMIDCEAGKTSMGLIMNKNTGYTLGELTNLIDKSFRVPLFCGGPVDVDRLFFVHTLGDIIPGAVRLVNDVYVGGDLSSVVNYIENGYPTDGYIRFFAGYSGWDAGQLDAEMNENSWTVASPLSDTEILSGEGDAYWHKAVRTLGPDFRSWLYHPQYPSQN